MIPQITTEFDNPQVKTYLRLADEWNSLERMNAGDRRVMMHATCIVSQATYLLEHYQEELKGTIVFAKTYDFGRTANHLSFPV